MALGRSGGLVFGCSHSWRVGRDALVTCCCCLRGVVCDQCSLHHEVASIATVFDLAGSVNGGPPHWAMVGRGRGRLTVAGERALGCLAVVDGARRADPS